MVHQHSHSGSLAPHYLLRAGILLAFAMFIVYLTKTDNLAYYIAPRMQSYVKYSSVALYAIAIYQVYLGIGALWGKKQADCGCEHPPSRSRLRSTVAYSLFVFPLLLGFLLPHTAMSSALADKKGMNLSTGTAAAAITKQLAAAAESDKALAPLASAAPSPSPSAAVAAAADAPQSLPAAGDVTDEQLKKMFVAPDEYSEDFAKMGMILYKRDLITVKPEIYMEVLSTIDLFKQNFFGKKIELTGFVYREKDMKQDQFVVGRFAVSCCSADASPYGVMVDFPTANHLDKDTWVKVTGTIDKGSYQNNDIFTIHATSIEKIPNPGTPYVYPNFDPIPELNK